MSRLAVVATLLMLLAPLVSRALQAQPVAMAVVMAEHLSHAMPGMDHAGHAPSMPEHGHDAPAGPHVNHAEACEYCVLAMRLLPWMALLLVLAPLPYRLAPFAPRRVDVPASLRWSAHLARGPPRFS